MEAIPVRRAHLLVAFSILWAFAVISALYVFLDLGWLHPGKIYILLLASIVVLTLWAIKLLRAFFRGFPFFFHAPLFISFMVTLNWGLPTLAGFLNSDFWIEHRTLIPVTPKYITLGWILISIGLVFIWLGYAVGIQKGYITENLTKETIRYTPSLIVVLQGYIIVTLLRLIRVMVTGVAYGAQAENWGPLAVFSQTSGYVESARFLFLAIVTRQVFQKRWSQSVFASFLAIELFFAFTSGFMKPVLHLAVVILGSAMSVNKFPGRIKIGTAVIFFTALSILIVPIAEELRLSHLRVVDTRSPRAVWTATLMAYESSWGRGFEYGWSSFVDKTIGRQAKVALSPGLILQRTPSEIPYLGVTEFMTLPLYLVPRFIWINKPVLSKGVWFSRTYRGLPVNTGSSSAMTIFGEAYLYYGWATLIIAMLILGFVLAKLFNFTVLAGRPEIYIAFLPEFLLGFEGQYSTHLIGLLQKWLILFLVYTAIQKVSRSGPKG